MLAVQEYMAQWVAKAAEKEKDYRGALSEVARAAAQCKGGPTGGAKASKSKKAGSNAEESAWYMDAIDLLVAFGADEGQQAANYIMDQLGSADLCVPLSTQTGARTGSKWLWLRVQVGFRMLEKGGRQSYVSLVHECNRPAVGVRGRQGATSSKSARGADLCVPFSVPTQG
jgi:hypothetical protein